MFAEAFGGLAAMFPTVFPEAEAVWPGEPVYDDGGSIVSPAKDIVKTCRAQVSAPTEAMRADAGFIQTDMRLIVPLTSLAGKLDTSARVRVLSGPHAGTWELQSVNLDTAACGWTCRGRRA